MNDISVVSYIKNDIEFVPQFWKHIHSYDPREIVILDTGSIDGTYELILSLERSEKISYIIDQQPIYNGRVGAFNKIIEMATSKWIVKLDIDELLSRNTQKNIIEIINSDEYNCISMPTIHHFINSDLFFNCLDSHPDYHQRIFKKEIFNTNSSINSNNHGCIMWNEPIKMVTFDYRDPLYHYSFLRSFEKIQKRSIVNYCIDIAKIFDNKILADIDINTNRYLKVFVDKKIKVTPAWQLEPTLIEFNDLEDYYTREFLKWGARVNFNKPEDLILHKISDWNKAEQKLNII